MSRSYHGPAALALALTAAACARTARQEVAPTNAATVIFSNQSLHQADVYAVPQTGTRVRIGTVPGGRTDTLMVEGAALPPGGTLTIVAELLATSASPRTGPLTLLGGDRIAVTLPSATTTLTVLPAPR